MYWTVSVESHFGVICDTHLVFNQAEDPILQFVQEIEKYNLTKGTIRIYARGRYWLSFIKDK